ncbi:hypothetical protein KIPB_013190, partial [Kipferlia bialata]|eukprot:g13190.t1
MQPNEAVPGSASTPATGSTGQSDGFQMTNEQMRMMIQQNQLRLQQMYMMQQMPMPQQMQ